MTEVTRLDEAGRWWRIGPHEVDLAAEENTYPGNVRAAVLAHRDATDDEGRDIAALLAADVDAGEPGALPITAGWLFARSQEIHARIWAELHRIEEAQRVHPA